MKIDSIVVFRQNYAICVSALLR